MLVCNCPMVLLLLFWSSDRAKQFSSVVQTLPNVTVLPALPGPTLKPVAHLHQLFAVQILFSCHVLHSQASSYDSA